MSNNSKLSEQLRDLPLHEPPAGGWEALQARQRGARRKTQVFYTGFAAAASILLTAGLLLWQPQSQLLEAPPPASAEVAQLMARSNQLEQTLAAVRPQAQRWNGNLASTAASLQDELTVVDLQLNYAEDKGAERLWQNRVALMAQLVQTHQRAAANSSNGDNEEYAI